MQALSPAPSSRVSTITRPGSPNWRRSAASIRRHWWPCRRPSASNRGAIAQMTDDRAPWAQPAEAWPWLNGGGGRHVARQMADLPEIVTYSNKAIAKLVGVAPIANDSGKRKGKRPVRGGRSSVRSILFLVAAIAARSDQSLGQVRARLVAAGKAQLFIRIRLARRCSV